MKYNEQHYDLIVIGGGATGSGIALDATLRGLKTLLIEKNDFSEGTSSRSTKLVHGGVRYLEDAVKKFDYKEFKLVQDGLKERARFLDNAPHLSRVITLVTPLYKWYEIPYMYIGLVLYDFISGKRRLGKSQIVGKKEIMKLFPSVKKKNLKGGVRYFDGAFNDSRMVISLLQSAKEKGCVIKNHTEVEGFIYNGKDTDDGEKVSGVKLHDKILNKEVVVTSTNIVNATGPFSDVLRKRDDKEAREILKVSSGIHIILDKKYLPNDEGLMIPETEDGRVLFMLPYLGKCLIGTTEEKSLLKEHPEVTSKDIDYLLRHTEKYFDVKINKNDIISSWAGLRPLVVDNTVNNTKDLNREQYISKSKSGLISIVGGKWTTYRKMSEDTVDFVVENNSDKSFKDCETISYKLVGSQTELTEIRLEIRKLKLEKELEDHLISFYGDQALKVVKYIAKYGSTKLHNDYPFLEAEVYYAIDNEFIIKPLDFLVRRIGLGFVDIKATNECLAMVSGIMKEQLKWTEDEYERLLKEAKKILLNNI